MAIQEEERLKRRKQLYKNKNKRSKLNKTQEIVNKNGNFTDKVSI